MKMPSQVPMFGAGSTSLFRLPGSAMARTAGRQVDGNTAEAQTDTGGRCWLNSSLDLAEGLDVIEGLQLDDLPLELARDFPPQ